MLVTAHQTPKTISMTIKLDVAIILRFTDILLRSIILDTMRARHTLIRYLPWILFGVIFTPFIFTYYSTGILTSGSLYTIFPVFGLLAWSLLCAQYISGALRILLRDSTNNSSTFTIASGIIIFVSLLLHPIILFAQRYIDTGTLPPISIVSYVGDARMYLVWIAVIALVIFLLFDVLRPYRESLRKSGIWQYVGLLQILAMLLIFVHGLQLGGLFADGWMRVWWILLNIVLVPCYVLHAYEDFHKVAQK